MAHVENPAQGQVWECDGKQRKIVEIIKNSGGVSIGWQRPGNEWHTYYAQAASWLKWAAKAQLVQPQLF